MKKYIILSLLIHIGIAAALISWSGISVFEWTQNLLNNVNTEQAIDEEIDEIDETKAVPKKSVRKVSKKKLKKIQKPKKKKPPVVQKKKVKPAPKKVEKAPTVQTETMAQPEVPSVVKEKELAENNQNAEPEVTYNPAEDLSTVEEQEENLVEESFQEMVNEVEQVAESEEDETSESSVQRDFEEINTNPQDLKKIIQEPPSQEDVKSSQALIPVQGNPEWSYPQTARQNKKEGSVFLQYFVDDTGFVDRIQLLKSSGYSILDNEALRVMARQRYQPGQSGWYKHQVDFKLKNM